MGTPVSIVGFSNESLNNVIDYSYFNFSNFFITGYSTGASTSGVSTSGAAMPSASKALNFAFHPSVVINRRSVTPSDPKTLADASSKSKDDSFTTPPFNARQGGTGTASKTWHSPSASQPHFMHAESSVRSAGSLSLSPKSVRQPSSQPVIGTIKLRPLKRLLEGAKDEDLTPKKGRKERTDEILESQEEQETESEENGRRQVVKGKKGKVPALERLEEDYDYNSQKHLPLVNMDEDSQRPEEEGTDHEEEVEERGESNSEEESEESEDEESEESEDEDEDEGEDVEGSPGQKGIYRGGKGRSKTTKRKKKKSDKDPEYNPDYDGMNDAEVDEMEARKKADEVLKKRQKEQEERRKALNKMDMSKVAPGQRTKLVAEREKLNLIFKLQQEDDGVGDSNEG